MYPEGEDGDGETAGLAFAEGSSHTGGEYTLVVYIPPTLECGGIYSTIYSIYSILHVSVYMCAGAGTRGGVKQCEAGVRGLPRCGGERLPAKATAGQ